LPEDVSGAVFVEDSFFDGAFFAHSAAGGRAGVLFIHGLPWLILVGIGWY